MDNSVVILLTVLVAIAYTVLVFSKKNDIWFLWAALFVAVSAALRYWIEVDAVRDFGAYFKSFLAVKSGTIPSEILFEPYRLLFFQIILLIGNLDSLGQIGMVYYLHFAIVTGFFLWLAYQKDISFELKLMLFLAFYPTIAFVWLRAGMGYIAVCYLMFTFTAGKLKNLHFVVPIFHASTLPILLTSKIKDLKMFQKVLILLVAVIVAFIISETNYAQYLLYKVDRYYETAARRDSINLLLFHIANILVFLYLAFINKRFRTNFMILALMGFYVAIYYVSPVMGLRMFPFVLIAGIVQRIGFPRYRFLTMLVCAGYLPIYFARFDQIFI